MRNILCLPMSLMFAVHAMVGCNTLHAWSHGRAPYGQSLWRHAGHDHRTGQHPGIPVGEHQHPAHPTQHDACSYVKAETLQFELSNDAAVSWAVSAPVNSSQRDVVSAAVGQPVWRVDHSSTQLYVWHCALII